ncbi:LOW QUALITY PROTEIN: Adhesion G protein-coupled receptor A3 [Frankliniella fusca]|uniref:Adhesion G protein-coupled receptor A3 n=1 Tax=Frankliniella fusca TaxID=407009 RepID=A0AAE1L5C0_9NEOP|nr:LOW QUALITY PROTEIN: Adhesion G protein-coupled receptor A3 [Frankliniella fusca]
MKWEIKFSKNAQASHDKRVAYVAARLEREEVHRKRSRLDIDNRQKSFSYKYFLDIEGKRIQVCRSTLKDTLGETDRFIRTVAENKNESYSGITVDDRRGKHTPPHALCLTNKAQAVQRHIASFPAYVSHYCRAKTKDQKYLASDLTITEMHKLYHQNEENPKVSLSTHTNQFHLSGLKFKPPQTDGCDTCTTLEVGKKNATTVEEKNVLERKHEIHLRKAEKAYNLKRAAKAAAKEDKTKRVLVCDLQQCLPTPHLTCKRISYSRQLYVFNFTVHDCTTGITHCYMWNETEGKRGSNEISTCLLKHISEEVPDYVQDLTIFTDCCSGQNRNSTISMMLFAALQENPSLKSINHIFLIPGHTFMPEVDNKHAIIEKHKRRLDKVNEPDEWYSIVHQAGMTDPENFPDGKFKVKHMTSFYDIAALAKCELVKRNKCMDGEPFSYLETHWWRYEKGSLGVVKVKASFTEAAKFRQLSFLRKGVRSDRLKMLLPCVQKLTSPVPISVKKKEDLLVLLQYLEDKYHEFHRCLPSSDKVRDLHPLSKGIVED